MGGLIRLVVFLFVVLTVIFVLWSLLARGAERRRLAQEWELEGMAGDREAHMREGLAVYERSLRRRLIFGVYLVPLAVIGTIVYVVNYM
jgi:flagellar biosynthesis/type III secretory pathway M-ring protein FliF/YscJ